MDKRLKHFLQNLIQQVHGKELPTALEEKMMLDLNLLLQQRLHEVAASALANETLRLQYMNLVMKEVSADELNNFLQQHIPDINQRLAKCTEDFKNEYLQVCQNQV